jgi:hypothetical protein
MFPLSNTLMPCKKQEVCQLEKKRKTACARWKRQPGFPFSVTFFTNLCCKQRLYGRKTDSEFQKANPDFRMIKK